MCKKCGKRFLAAMVFVTGSATSLNAETFSPPEGCEAFPIVQDLSCNTTTLWHSAPLDGKADDNI